MLVELHIKNFAIIDELNLTLKPGFNVFTGETGAGKSILIDALNQILGERADSTVIRTGSETCTVDALLDIKDSPHLPQLLDESGFPLDNENELLIRRELSRSGKNRCWINGQLSTLATLQKIGEELADLHGQHDHQSLLKIQQQLEFLDDYGENGELRIQVFKGWKELRAILDELGRLRESDTQKQARMEDLKYQLQEIEGAALQPGEEETLKSTKERLRNSENLFQLIDGLSAEIIGRESTEHPGILSSLARCKTLLEELTRMDPLWESHQELLEQAKIALDQLGREVADYHSKLDIEPDQLEQIEERLDILHRLKRKYRCESIETLMEDAIRWKLELEGLNHQEERIQDLENSYQKESIKMGNLLSTLSESRQKAAAKLAAALQKELAELGMPHASFKIQVTPRTGNEKWFKYRETSYDLTQTGWDDIEFFFSANPGEPAKPLSKVASGGELSRVMLALKATFAKTDSIPTLIFDEIDAGIGGQIAHCLAQKLKQISQNRQVLVITHLPAIAARADAHYQVAKLQDKQTTSTQITQLSETERKVEISRMLGGNGTDKTSLKYAEELLEQK